MRLICPNCDAEYQVDDAAIPEAGRDVQCSNCGHAWFQLPADVEHARDAEEELYGAPSGDPAPPVAAEPTETADRTSGQTEDPAADRAADEAADVPRDPPIVAEPEAVPPPDLPQPAIARQSIAESVLSVLREEAERETAVRRDENPGLRPADAAGRIETQTELGLGTAAQPAQPSAAARHIARLKGADPDSSLMQVEPKAAARRDLLPDIEEINSTLRSETDRVQAEMDEIDALPVIKPRRRGFRSGFVLMMIVGVCLAMAYVMAPRIIAQIPGSAPSMRAYVAKVDQGRLWLDGVMKAASGSLHSLSGDTK